LNKNDISYIGSHGQTIYHDIDEKGNVTSTFQLGESSVISTKTGITTIHDFRTSDVSVGGNSFKLIYFRTRSTINVNLENNKKGQYLII
jgi:anhydro-N-acetylmuramic acid kinase